MGCFSEEFFSILYTNNSIFTKKIVHNLDMWFQFPICMFCTYDRNSVYKKKLIRVYATLVYQGEAYITPS